MTRSLQFEIKYRQFPNGEGRLREPAPEPAHDSAKLIKPSLTYDHRRLAPAEAARFMAVIIRDL